MNEQMNEQTREDVSDNHTVGDWVKLVRAALQGGSQLCVCRELSCSKYSHCGQAGSQGCLPDCDFTGPGAQPLRSYREEALLPSQGRAVGPEVVGDCVLCKCHFFRDWNCRAEAL
jgi:hypothetical protein